MRDTKQAELRAHYELGAEQDRLAVGGRRLEFIRTTEIVLQRLRRELRAAGLSVADLVSVEGPAFLLGDLSERLDDPVAREVVLDTARAVERVPEMLGIGSHLLATGLRLAPTDRTGHALPAVLGVIAPRTAGISMPTWSWRRVSGGLGHHERAAAA